MKKLLLLLLFPLLSFGQLTQTSVQDTINKYIKSPIAVTSLKKTFTTLNQFTGSKQATLVSGTNIKTLNGNTLLGSGNLTLTIPTNSDYVDRTTAQSVAGVKNFTDTPTFTGTYTNGQATFGSMSQGGRINFLEGTGGSATLKLGFIGSTSSSASLSYSGPSLSIQNTSTGAVAIQSNGFLDFLSANTQTMRMQNGRTIIGPSTTDNAAWILQIVGATRVTGLLTLDSGLSGGSWGNNTGMVPDANDTRNIGSASLKYSAIWASNFIGTGANSYFGNFEANRGVYFRQGTATQLPGGFHLTSGNYFIQTPGAVPTDNTARLQVSDAAESTGSKKLATFTGGAHTNQTASTELVDVDFALNRTVQFATGAKTAQNAVMFRAPTYSAVGATTTTSASTVTITGAPAAGTNMSITNPYALWVQGGTTNLVGNAKVGGTLDVTGNLTASTKVTSPLYLAGSDTLATKKYVQSNQWTGKPVVWCGNSIPELFQPNSYPELAGRMLGTSATYNTSIGGTRMIFTGSDPGMSGTIAENVAVNAGYGYISYENTIMKYLASPYNCKLVVIDHGFNDANLMPGALGTISSTSKANFYGAYDYVIKEILTTYPDVRIVLVTPINRYPFGDVSGIALHESIRTALKELGDKWGLQVLDLGGRMGFNSMTSVAGQYTSDGVNPNATNINRVAAVAYRFLLGVN